MVLSVGATTDLFHFTNGGVGYLTALERLNIVLSYIYIGVVVQSDCVYCVCVEIMVGRMKKKGFFVCEKKVICFFAFGPPHKLFVVCWVCVCCVLLCGDVS